jgi:predicted nucleic acid-binding Zn ribbon protein
MHPAQNAAADFQARRDREQRRHYARKPKKIADVLAQLITARGYGRIQSDANLTAAWQQAAGPAISQYTRPGRLRRGTLEVTVSNSTIVQELTFQKQQILAELQTAMADANIRDIRFRVGSLG